MSVARRQAFGVFLGANSGKDPDFTKFAEDVGDMFVAQNWKYGNVCPGLCGA
jgi:hypothetical protein